MTLTAKLSAPRTRWNYNSVVTFCTECNGAGVVRAHRAATINDPYPECECDCGLGEHEPVCEVCGFNQPITGYDCLVCDTVSSLVESDLRKLDANAFVAAFKVALEEARLDIGIDDQAIARPAESYIPGGM